MQTKKINIFGCSHKPNFPKAFEIQFQAIALIHRSRLIKAVKLMWTKNIKYSVLVKNLISKKAFKIIVCAIALVHKFIFIDKSIWTKTHIENSVAFKNLISNKSIKNSISGNPPRSQVKIH